MPECGWNGCKNLERTLEAMRAELRLTAVVARHGMGPHTLRERLMRLSFELGGVCEACALQLGALVGGDGISSRCPHPARGPAAITAELLAVATSGGEVSTLRMGAAKLAFELSGQCEGCALLLVASVETGGRLHA